MRLREKTSSEEPESAPISANESPEFSPLQGNSSRTSLASVGSSSALDKEEDAKVSTQLDATEVDTDATVMVASLNDPEVPLAKVAEKDLRGKDSRRAAQGSIGTNKVAEAVLQAQTNDNGPIASVDMKKSERKDSSPVLQVGPDTDGGAEYGKLIDTYGNEFQLPTFTVKDIRDAIPKHCYNRSGFRFLSYVFSDIFMLGTVFLLAYTFIRPEYVSSTLARGVLWAAYGFRK